MPSQLTNHFPHAKCACSTAQSKSSEQTRNISDIKGSKQISAWRVAGRPEAPGPRAEGGVSIQRGGRGSDLTCPAPPSPGAYAPARRRRRRRRWRWRPSRWRRRLRGRLGNAGATCCAGGGAAARGGSMAGVERASERNSVVCRGDRIVWKSRVLSRTNPTLLLGWQRSKQIWIFLF